MAINFDWIEKKTYICFDLMNAKQYSLIALLILKRCGGKSRRSCHLCDSGTLRCVKRQPYTHHCGWMHRFCMNVYIQLRFKSGNLKFKPDYMFLTFVFLPEEWDISKENSSLMWFKCKYGLIKRLESNNKLVDVSIHFLLWCLWRRENVRFRP